MPKETVNDITSDHIKVAVQWSRDGQVQLATTSPSAYSGLRLKDPFLRARDDVEGEPFNGWYATLDRAGINKLIRDLRKARDQAFGADA